MKVNPYEAATGGQSRCSKFAVEKASLDDSNDITSAQHESFKEPTPVHPLLRRREVLCTGHDDMSLLRESGKQRVQQIP